MSWLSKTFKKATGVSLTSAVVGTAVGVATGNPAAGISAASAVGSLQKAQAVADAQPAPTSAHGQVLDFSNNPAGVTAPAPAKDAPPTSPPVIVQKADSMGAWLVLGAVLFFIMKG